MKEKIVMSLGGALVVPGKLGRIDTAYLKDFSQFIRERVASYDFYIVVGGGRTARRYIDAASEVLGESIQDCDKDWLGIHTTRLNAHFLRTILKDVARPRIIQNPNIPVNGTHPVVLGSGYRPGNTTDWIATRIAVVNGVNTVINLSNIDYAYTADPKKNPNAKPIREIGWQDFRDKVVGHEYMPGMNVPFDPVASEDAQENDLKVVIANGRNLNNLANILEGRKYVGTTVSDQF